MEEPKSSAVLTVNEISVPLGFSALAFPREIATIYVSPMVPCVIRRLVLADECVADRCVEHEDCLEFPELGLACLLARLPPGVVPLPGFEIVSVRCELVEYVPGEALAGSLFSTRSRVSPIASFQVVPGQVIVFHARNRSDHLREVRGYWDCVRHPEHHWL